MSMPNHTDDEVDLLGLIAGIWRGRMILLLFMGIFLLLSVAYLHFAKRLYTASMTIVPAHSISGMDRISSGIGGLASLAGIKLPSGAPQSPFDSYIMAVGTPETAAAMLNQKEIAGAVFPDEWDSKTKAWRQPSSPLRGVKNAIKWTLTGRVAPWTPPNAQMMQKYIKKNVVVNKDKETGAVTLSYDNKDPRFAEKFLWCLHRIIDSSIRQKTLKESAEYISYISQQLKSVTVSEQHEALAQLLSDEEKKAILAGSGLPYAADVFSAPYAPNTPSKPIPILVLGVGMFLGAGIGSVYVLLVGRFETFRILHFALCDLFGGGQRGRKRQANTSEASKYETSDGIGECR